MTITSKEVAEMLGKRHDNLLRAIRKYITQLGDEGVLSELRVRLLRLSMLQCLERRLL